MLVRCHVLFNALICLQELLVLIEETCCTMVVFYFIV
uniref:Uncharacterized protein n=1 Tax=Arundo donax TaxID=35708 RepID=A0A0A8ZSY7_ARUDO